MITTPVSKTTTFETAHERWRARRFCQFDVSRKLVSNLGVSLVSTRAFMRH